MFPFLIEFLTCSVFDVEKTIASSGLTTPPWQVPCSGNSGLTPAFRHRKIPSFIALGAMSRFMMEVWLILSKHLDISSSMTRFPFPLAKERRFENRTFCASCALRPGLNP